MPASADKFTQSAQAWLRAGHDKPPIGAALLSPRAPAHLPCYQCAGRLSRWL